MSKLIMIVSPSIDFHLCFKHILEVDGFSTRLARSADEALAWKNDIAALVLDCRDPTSYAQDICAPVKADATAQHVLVVGIIEEGAGTVYLDMVRARADRCFHRPFEPIKLLEYLRSNASSLDTKNGQRILRHAGIELDTAARTVRRDEEMLQIGLIEFELLHLLLSDPGRVFSRAELMKAAWQGRTDGHARAVDVHIGLLRKALKSNDPNELIRTFRGLGYALHTQI